MKKLYILTLILICSAFSASASHLMGGQITCQQISGNNYEVKLTLYRDSTGINIAGSITLKITNITTGTFSNLTLTHSGAVNFLNGVEQYTYTGNTQLVAATDYMISVTHCCRNGAILNMANPMMESLFLNTNIFTDSLGNSTPVFLNPPVTIAQNNMVYQYNPLPFDADGDSLVWSLTTPLSSLTTPVAGYLLPFADPGNTFTLNPATGEITWTPNTMGHFVASFLLEEFRAGVKIGEIRRDMQIIVLGQNANPNQSMVNKSPFNYSPQGEFYINAPVGQQTVLTVTVSDADNDLLQLSMSGEPFVLNQNRAVYTAANGTGSANVSLIWTPTQSELRTAPYVVAMRTREFHGPHVFTSDFTFQIFVGGVLSTPDQPAANTLAQVYPNPVKGSMNIPFNIENASHVSITLMNMNGQIVANLLDQQMPAGNNHFITNLPALAKGVYMLNFKAGENNPVMQKIIISE